MKIYWEPAIYEHKAALINKSPAEVAFSAELLAAAVLKEYEIYHADYLTIGLDVYNIEAESLGAKLIVPSDNQCPALANPLFEINNLPEKLVVPEIPGDGRFPLVLAAAKEVTNVVGNKTRIRVAASGPFSLAAKLIGIDNLVMSLLLADGYAVSFLEFTTQICERWSRCLRENYLEVIFFDSMAVPPLLNPSMFEEHVLPLLRRLMSLLAETGQQERELVIGGNTVSIADFLPRTGANVLLCDYVADVAAFKSAIGDDCNLKIRRNLNPELLKTHASDKLVEQFCCELEIFRNPIAGTGILPYDFEPHLLVNFMQSLDTKMLERV